MEGIGDEFRTVAEEAEAEAVDDVDPPVAVGVPEVGAFAAVGDGGEDHVLPQEIESGDGAGVGQDVAVVGGEGFGFRVFCGVSGDETGEMRLLEGREAAVLGALNGFEGAEGDLPAVAAFEGFDGDGVGRGGGAGRSGTGLEAGAEGADLLFNNGEAIGGGAGGRGGGKIGRRGAVLKCWGRSGRLEFVRGKLGVQPGGKIGDAGLVFHQLAEGDLETKVFFEGVGGGSQEQGVETEVEEGRGGVGGGGVDAGNLVELGAEFPNKMGMA